METLERRALVAVIAAVLMVGFDRPADFTSQHGRGWQVVVYVLGLLCFGAAAAVAAMVLAPRDVVGLPREKRERVLFYAFVGIAAAVLSVVVLRAYGTIYFHRHPTAGLAP